MLSGLDLFTGIGGITLSLEPWVRPVAYCERDRYAQSVLLDRMESHQMPSAPIWDDVRTLSASVLPEVDIITGGFPCQDISVAGTGSGLDGKRSGLYWELHRLVKELRPGWVFLENVPAIRTRGLREVVESLADLGYDCRWTRVSAAEVGAPHLRRRWFLLAHTHDAGRSEQRGTCATPQELQASQRCGGWETEPTVDRVVDGLPNRVDRIKGLGNAVVPAQAREAFVRLLGGCS